MEVQRGTNEYALVDAFQALQDAHDREIRKIGEIDRVVANEVMFNNLSDREAAQIYSSRLIVLGFGRGDEKSVYLGVREIMDEDKIHTRLIPVGVRKCGVPCANFNRGYTTADFEFFESLYEESVDFIERNKLNYNLEQGIHITL